MADYIHCAEWMNYHDDYTDITEIDTSKITIGGEFDYTGAEITDKEWFKILLNNHQLLLTHKWYTKKAYNYNTLGEKCETSSCGSTGVNCDVEHYSNIVNNLPLRPDNYNVNTNGGAYVPRVGQYASKSYRSKALKWYRFTQWREEREYPGPIVTSGVMNYTTEGHLNIYAEAVCPISTFLVVEGVICPPCTKYIEGECIPITDKSLLTESNGCWYDNGTKCFCEEIPPPSPTDCLDIEFFWEPYEHETRYPSYMHV